MPTATQKSACEKHNLLNKESEVPSGSEEPASLDQEIDQEPDPEVTFHPSRAQQAIPSMFMPYIEGPKMDWTVTDALYQKFLKWHLKCMNIPECELVVLPEFQKCKKVIAWSRDFGMDQYVSLGLSNEDLNKTQSGENMKNSANHRPMKCMPTLIFLQASGKEIEEWMSGIMQSKLKSIWLRTPQKQPRFCIMTSFVFSCMMRNLYPRP